MQVGLCLAGGTTELTRVDLGQLADLGFTSLFVGCHEDDIHWRAEEVASFVRRARSRHFEIYAVPWGYGRVLDPDPALPSLYVDTHPQSLQVDNRGRRCPKACPNNPYFLEWFSSSMRTLAWLVEANGFLWDEPSFHHSRGTWACRCQYCQRLYQASQGREMPRDFEAEVVAFREASLVIFLLAAAAAIQAVDYRLESLVTPTPALPGTPVFSGTGDWNAIAASSACDALSAFVPWQHHNAPLEQALRDVHQEAHRHAQRHGKRSLLWTAASPSTRDRVLDAIRLAAEAGVERLVLADYGSLIEGSGFARFANDLQQAIAAVR
jgi:hypothetical protein